jgi:RNA-binding protein NOB1
LVLNLVVDSGPIIKGVPLHTIGKHIWTIPEVLAEIRDKRSRQKITAMIPFDFKVKEPSVEAIQFVMDFARKTGDLRSLSKTDLKVIALTYMLEKEVVGSVAHLHSEPRHLKVHATSKGMLTTSATTTTTADGTPAHAKAAAPTRQKALRAVPSTTEPEPTAGPTPTPTPEPDPTAALQDKKAKAEPTVSKQHKVQAPPPPPTLKVCSGCGHSFPKSEFSKSQWVKPAGEPRLSKGCVGKLKQFSPLETHPPHAHKGESGHSETSAATSGSEVLPRITSDPEEVASSTAGGSDERSAERRDPPPPAAVAAATNVAAAATNVATSSPVGTLSEDSAAAEVAPEEARQSSSSSAPPPPDQPRQSRIIGSSHWVKTVKLSETDDPAEGWISAEDVNTGAANPWKDSTMVSSAKAKTMQVGCITTDFAMQNVLLQVGLHLVSADGMMVNKLKQWLLKCSSCFKVCHDMTKLFCPSCGSATLDKLSYSVDKNGSTRFHYRKNKPVNLRGTKYSIPKSTGGRYETDLLLREDQLFQGKWAQKAAASSSMKSMFGEIATEGFDTFEKKKSVGYGPEVVVGYGRKNPNATRGRERRGKKRTD